MQPQETGGLDLMHGVAGLGGGALGTFLTWFWRAARIEPQFRLDLEAAKKEVETKIEDSEKRQIEKVEEIVGHFSEAFSGIRQQINDRALEIEREFMRKKDYESLRREDREAFDKFETRILKEFEGLERNIGAIVSGRKP
jgi:rRNA processing protein Gar1